MNQLLSFGQLPTATMFITTSYESCGIRHDKVNSELINSAVDTGPNGRDPCTDYHDISSEHRKYPWGH